MAAETWDEETTDVSVIEYRPIWKYSIFFSWIGSI